MAMVAWTLAIMQEILGCVHTLTHVPWFHHVLKLSGIVDVFVGGPLQIASM